MIRLGRIRARPRSDRTLPGPLRRRDWTAQAPAPAGPAGRAAGQPHEGHRRPGAAPPRPQGRRPGPGPGDPRLGTMLRGPGGPRAAPAASSTWPPRPTPGRSPRSSPRPRCCNAPASTRRPRWCWSGPSRERAPDNPELAMMLAGVRLSEQAMLPPQQRSWGDFDQAVEQAEQALRVAAEAEGIADPQSVDLAIVLADRDLLEGRIDQADARLQGVLGSSPNNPGLWAARAELMPTIRPARAGHPPDRAGPGGHRRWRQLRIARGDPRQPGQGPGGPAPPDRGGRPPPARRAGRALGGARPAPAGPGRPRRRRPGVPQLGEARAGRPPPDPRPDRRRPAGRPDRRRPEAARQPLRGPCRPVARLRRTLRGPRGHRRSPLSPGPGRDPAPGGRAHGDGPADPGTSAGDGTGKTNPRLKLLEQAREIIDGPEGVLVDARELADAHLLLGRILEARGEPEEAVISYKNAWDRGAEQALTPLTDLLARLGRFDELEQLALDSEADLRLSQLSAQALLGAGEVSRASRLIDRAGTTPTPRPP